MQLWRRPDLLHGKLICFWVIILLVEVHHSQQFQDILPLLFQWDLLMIYRLESPREDGIDKVMNTYKLDAIMAPTGSPAWKTDLLLGDHFVGGSSSLAAISGYPAITVSDEL